MIVKQSDIRFRKRCLEEETQLVAFCREHNQVLVNYYGTTPETKGDSIRQVAV